jgi:hypothetical protein
MKKIKDININLVQKFSFLKYVNHAIRKLRLYTQVCIYVGLHVCACMYLYINASTYVCVYIYMYVCRYPFSGIYTMLAYGFSLSILFVLTQSKNQHSMAVTSYIYIRCASYSNLEGGAAYPEWFSLVSLP